MTPLEEKLSKLEDLIINWGLPDALADELRTVFKDFYLEILEEDIKMAKEKQIQLEHGQIIVNNMQKVSDVSYDNGWNSALSTLIDSKREDLEALNKLKAN